MINKKYLSIFLIGSFSALALPYFFFFPILVIGLILFISEIKQSKDYKDSFKIGLAFGFGYFLVGMHWIVFPLMVDKNYYVFIPFALFFFPLFLSFFYGGVAIITSVYLEKIRKFNQYYFFNSFVIALIFFFFEFVRSNIFGGFPWNLSSHVWGFNNNLVIISKYIGSYGLSFLTILWIVILSNFFSKKNYREFLIIFSIFPISLYLFGNLFSDEHLKKKIKIRLVQPNISQKIKWSKEHMQENLMKLKKYSVKDLDTSNPPNIIVWPEVAIPFFLNKEEDLKKYILANIPLKTYLITGALRYEKVGNDYKIFNSLYLLKQNEIVAYYDKVRLVPFGEFMPFSGILKLKKLTEGRKDFSSGTGRKELFIKDFKERIISFEPSICYEGIFPEKKLTFLNPNLLINITNDAWFGRTTGPKQHQIANMFRAIERGLPLVRVSNSGISNIIDINGKIMANLPLNEEGYKEIEIRLGSGETFYSKFGLYSLVYLIIFLFLFCLSLDIFLLKKKLKNFL